MKKSLALILLCLIAPHVTVAQWSFDISFGLNQSSEQFQKPEGNELSSPFIDPRWRILGTLGANYHFDRLSLYGEAGVLNYRTFLQIGPFLDPTGVGIQAPFFEGWLQWIGPYLELGSEYSVFSKQRFEVRAGLGMGYSYDAWNSNRALPETTSGSGRIDGSLEYASTLTYRRIQNLFLTPAFTLTRTTTSGHQIWLKGKYNQGLLTQHDGQFDFVRSLNTDNEIVDEFAFDVLLRNSFYSISVGITLVPSK